MFACKQKEELDIAKSKVSAWDDANFGSMIVLPMDLGMEDESAPPPEDSMSTESPLLDHSVARSKSGTSVDESTGSSLTEVKEAPKKGKSGHKFVSEAVKTDMAAERTFFKWLWAGVHIGAIGTVISVTLGTDNHDPYRQAFVTFAWSVAFGLVLYGLFAYNRRRRALREGRLALLPEVTREWGPYIVVFALALVVGSGLLCATFTNDGQPQSGTHSGLGVLQALDAVEPPRGANFSTTVNPPTGVA